VNLRSVLGRASHLTRAGKRCAALREIVDTGLAGRCVRLSPLIAFWNI
jgi:hypothetical protein